MININCLYLLFSFLQFRLLIFYKIFPDELELKIIYNKYIYDYKGTYSVEKYKNSLKKINETYALYTHISHIDSISDDYSLNEFEEELSNLLKEYYQKYYDNSAFIILINKNAKVIIIMGSNYKKIFTNNKSNKISDFKNYIEFEFDYEKNKFIFNINNVFEYTINQLNNALEGKKIEPSKNYKNYYIIIIIVVFAIFTIFFIIIFCCLFCKNKIKLQRNINIQDYKPLV